MDLEVGAGRVSMRACDLYVIPAGVPHRVLPGSAGLLLLVDR
ncbi:MAG TPA: hypothetical protein VHM01_06880 [Alphaproteobacteria bacterium]|nr:hypothetical protein [Alphaproteobacteria bacterium]